MEYPEVPLLKWINLPYNVVISFPLGFSERAVLSSVIKAIPYSILITDRDVDDYYKELSRGNRRIKFPKIIGKIYNFSELPERVSDDITIIVYSNTFNPRDLEQYADNKFIFILEYGYTTELFDLIEDLYSPFIYGLFTSRTSFTIELLKVFRVKIPNFTLEYSELDEDIETARCNFEYRDDWENKEDLLVEKGGWMRPEYLDEIYERGPKLKIIFDLISKNPQNTVILTSFSSEYGAYLVANTLRLQKYDVLLATDNGSESSRRKIYEKFNDTKDQSIKVLVTNVIPEIMLDNVRRIIFFDGTSIDTRRDLINKCRDTQINLIALEAIINGYETVDQYANNSFIEYQRDSKEAYEDVSKISSRIMLNNKGEAIVQQRSSPR